MGTGTRIGMPIHRESAPMFSTCSKAGRFHHETEAPDIDYRRHRGGVGSRLTAPTHSKLQDSSSRHTDSHREEFPAFSKRNDQHKCDGWRAGSSALRLCFRVDAACQERRSERQSLKIEKGPALLSGLMPTPEAVGVLTTGSLNS